MEPEYFALIRIMIFIVVSIYLIAISWRSLHNPKCHGFYRFFVFEGTLILVLLNYPFWFEKPFSPLQVVSWIFLFSSIFFVAHGTYMLKRAGGSGRPKNPENLAFENTVNLVIDGLYKYIRHPMYSSLLLLAWGAFIKQVTIYGTMAVLTTTLFVIATAKVEERENVSFFGSRYEEYKKRTRMFIPYIF